MLSFIEPVCKKVCTDALYEYFGNKFWPQMLIKEVPKVLTNWEQLLAYAGAIDPRLAAAVGAGVFVVGGIIYRVTHRDGQAVVEPVAATETKTQRDPEEKEAAVDVDQQTKEFERQLELELAEQEAARKAEQEEAVKQEAAKKAEREEAARKLAEQETARKAEQEEAVKKQEAAKKAEREEAVKQEAAKKAEREEAAKKADDQKAQKKAALQRTLKAEREKAALQQLVKPQGAVDPSTDFAQRLQEQSIALAKEQELKKEEERKANEARQKALDKAPAVEREEAATFEARREEAKAVFKAEVERKKTMVPAAPAPVAVDEQMYRVEVPQNMFVSAYLNHCQNPVLKARAMANQRPQVTNEILNGFGVVNGKIPASRVPAFNAELDRLDLGQFKVGL